MKKIINNKVYDTDTANKLGSYSYDSYNSLNYIRERLYRKKTGEFFLHGEGGANSKYARTVGANSWSSGETIMPLSYEDAQKWAEEKLTVEEYENVFGAVEESDECVRKEFTLRKSTVEKIKRLASQQGITQQELIENIISEKEC